MQLTHLRLRHFRNIAALDWDPAPGLNLLWGDNGEGKTNVLEGVHFALTGRLIRSRADDPCLPWGRPLDPLDPTLAAAELHTRSGVRNVRVTLGPAGKRAFADGRHVPRLADFWGRAPLVVFTPEEARLFQSAPGDRRRFLDQVLCQLSPAYLGDLQRYHTALRQLNAALRSESAAAARGQAEAYHPELARTGAALLRTRDARIRLAREGLAARFNALGGRGRLDMHYDTAARRAGLDPAADPDELRERYEARLLAGFEEDRRVGHCRFGPHRDDLTLVLDGHDMRRFGSQGQHRLAALALKLETAGWLADALEEPPLVLLDDFGSELDPGRRAAVLDDLRRAMQVLVTTTDPRDLGDPARFAASRRIVGGAFADGC